MPASPQLARRCGEEGSLLAFLLPLLLLLGLFLAGTLKVTAASQARLALQSRLDVCAVRLAVAREKLYGRLTELNQAIEVTVAGITAARAAMLVPGAGEAAAATEAVLLRANEALAAAGTAAIAAEAAREAASLSCAPNRWSKDRAGCLATPPAAGAFERQATLFPDVAGALFLREHAPGKVRCAARGAVTALALSGDPALHVEGFSDRYEY